MRLNIVVMIIVALVSMSVVTGFDRSQEHGMDRRLVEPPEITLQAVEGSETLSSHLGGSWSVKLDPRTGLAVMVQGSGSYLPLEGHPRPDGEITLETLEPAVRAFMERNRDLLLPDNGRLDLDLHSSIIRDHGRLASLYFDWSVNGIRVENARIFVRLNSGNVTQFGAPLVGGTIPDPGDMIELDEALDFLFLYSGDRELARIHDEPELLLQPENDGDGLTYRAVWVLTYTVPGRIETWEGRIDAVTGEIVSFRDINRYGRVTGGVYERTVTDPEVVTPMSLTDVRLESGTVTTDSAGNFTYGGGDLFTGLAGRYFNTNCEGCTSPAQTGLEMNLGAGILDLGTGGVDEVGNGVSNKAERNSYFHMNRVRRVAARWLPTFSWLDNNITVNLNINDTCNAYWNGTANFYRSGGGCGNTGEIADVVQHEWGHGIDGNTHSGDGATGEGTADTVAMHMSHDSAVGPYFHDDGRPVRQLDSDLSSRGLMTVSNVGSKCVPGSGPLGREVHCEGEIYGQVSWDLIQTLVAKHGNHTGWRTSERIFFTSLPDAGSYLATEIDPVYDAYINADDDDGNLTNGTPNGQEIYDAFNLHGIAGTNYGSSTPCTRPVEPVVTPVADCDSVQLSWDPVTGADIYEVLRAEVRLNGPFFSLDELPSTETGYIDTEVSPGVDYWYSVMAVDASGCESTIESPVHTRLTDQPILSVSAAVADDTPRGNRSGFADPGEEVDVVVTMTNYGVVDAEAVQGTLTALTDGVAVLQGVDDWPAIPAGQQADNLGVLRFESDGLVRSCGDRLMFSLVPAEKVACSDDTSYISVVLGTRLVEISDDFETDRGWTHDAVNSTASSGHWVYGDPDGTDYQPEYDSTIDPGVNCWFTATNGGGVGTDDVDDGVTILLSPLYDLSTLDIAFVAYDRWFANRDLGEDEGDFFKADVSSDGGATWVNLETMGTNESAASWTSVEFRLNDFISLTSQVQFRFQVADGTATGNLIEAAVDEFRIESPQCDDTPACYVKPDFDGLQSALPGESCGETSLSWNPASTNCQNAEITYNVYRSETAGFTPDGATMVASGLTGTTWDDSLLYPGTTYHYIVRAYDSRSGEEENLAEHSVVAPASPDIRPPQFDGLQSAAGGSSCGETVLAWNSAVETCNSPVAYEIYRSTDPGFTPGATSRIGSGMSLTFTDAALAPGQSYTYVVRSRDGVGNEDANDIRFTVGATVLDKSLLEVDFESAAEWTVVDPNDATSGNWEHGDPQGTSYQPEDDNTADPGVNAWITGLSAGGGGGDYDIDGGTTTLLSSLYDLSSAVDPAVNYYRWFTNDRGNAPGEDPFLVEASNDDGVTWVTLEEVNSGTPLAWVEASIPLEGRIAPTGLMRFRFTAKDVGDGSLVEAGIDDFALIDLGQGCSDCVLPVDPVGNITMSRQGDDIVMDWSAEPSTATRYVVYSLSGDAFDEAVRVGSTGTKSFIHEGAASSVDSFYYRVTAVDECGNESALH